MKKKQFKYHYFKLVLLAILAFPFVVSGQIDLDLPSKSIEIGGLESNEVEKSVLLSPEKATGLISSGTVVLKSKMNLSEPLPGKKKREVQFNNGDKFAQKEHTALKKKMNKDYAKADAALKPEFYKDQYLGDFKSGSKFVNFLYRDHEFVDGDRVSVSINDVVIHPNIYLQGDFQGFYFDLKKGLSLIHI